MNALVAGDFAVSRGVPAVSPVPDDVARQMRTYVEDHGETLTELIDDTWETSVAQWMGSFWDVLVDLRTVESGPSDLVLAVRVFEGDAGFRFEIGPIYVP